ncbi:thioredoxin family protein [bacterium]|nr:thioredoxin family protein [bacterium]
MQKKFILLWALLLLLPVYAGVFDIALKNNDKVFLYLYTDSCGYCVKFNPKYEMLVKEFSNKCKFLKINANTKEGAELMYKFNSPYVPFVVVIDNNKNSIDKISSRCLLDYSCVKNIMSEFTSN